VKIKPCCSHLENGHFWPKNTKLALVSSQGLKRRWKSVFCNNSVQIWLVSTKNSFLAHRDWSSLSSEPSKSGSLSIHFALTNSTQTSSRWFAFILSFRNFLAGQQSKNSALHMFLVVNQLEEQEFSLKKSKFQQILGSGRRLHGIFSSSQIFLAGQQ
jgi:hypothetical protein